MGLTENQIKALALDKNISVTAGAGSGKTKILVERFLKIALRYPERMGAVLAITFTKKAAGEMQERIALEVDALLKKNTDSKKRLTLLTIRDQLSAASISTIHGFCSRVLHEFPIEAGLTPDFSEMDDLQQSILLHSVIDTVFSNIDKNEGQDYQSLFTHISSAEIRELLKQTLNAPYEMQQLCDKFENMDSTEYLNFIETQWLNIIHDSVIPPADYLDICNLASLILEYDSVTLKDEKGQVIFSAIKAVANLSCEQDPGIEAYKAILNLAENVTSKDGTTLKTARSLGSKKSWSERSLEYLLELSAIGSVILARFKLKNLSLPDTENDLFWFGLLKQILKLYTENEKEYRHQKNLRGWLDFEDLQILTLQLLRENENIRIQLAKRFEYIMVDEFQDTNALQWEIVRLLALEKGDLSANKLFVVGDPKQSIYGFRDADIRVFREVKNLFAKLAGSVNGSGDIVFKDSFRFLPGLNSFVNFMFSKILQETDTNPFEVGYHSLAAMRDVPDTGWCELALLEESDSEEEYMAQTISRLIEQKSKVYLWEDAEVSRPVQHGDIAILMRNRNALLKIEQALRKQGIPFNTVKGIGFWQKQEIYDLYHLLRFLVNPQDDLALTGILRSPLFLLSDETLYFLACIEAVDLFSKMKLACTDAFDLPSTDKTNLGETVRILEKWLSLRNRLPLKDFFGIIVKDLHLSAFYLTQLNGEQLLANVEKLFQHLQHFDASGFGGLGEFVTHMDELIENGMREGEAQIILEDMATVKIMTIHAAKGLQFPVVFVPYLNTENGKSHQGVHLNSEFGLAISPSKYEKESSLLYGLLQYRQKQKDVAEAKRLFYVAVTRASNYLFMSAQIKSDKIQKNSALLWMTEVFDNLLERDEVIIKDFKLSLVRELQQTPGTDFDFPSFKAGMKKLYSALSGEDEPVESLPAHLEIIPPGLGGRIFSPTRIMTFMKDPQEYYQKYHLGFFETDYEAFSAAIETDEFGLLKGKIVHRFLELLPTASTSEPQMIERILFEFEVFDPQLRTRMKQELQQVKQKISDSPVARKIVYAASGKNEVNITIKIGDDSLAGTLDRIYQNNTGLWEIVDYKTNQITASQIVRESRRYLYQIQAYALMASKIYPKQEDFPVRLYFLNPDQFFVQKFNRSQIQAIEESFITIIQQIKDMFPVK